MTPAHGFLAVAAMIVAGSGLPTGAEQEPQMQIRAAVDVVRLRVAVVHTAGGEIPPLNADDFEVYDNGVLQNVRLLHRPEDTPMRVALVIDASPSLRPWWRTVQRTAITFLTRLGLSACAYVLPFSDGIGPGMWGRYLADDWRQFLTAAPRGAGTSLHDALIIALDQLTDADEFALAASRAPDARGAAKDATGEAWLTAAADAPLPTGVPTRGSLLAAMKRMVAEIVRNSPPTRLGNCELRYVPSAGAGAGNDLPLPVDESIKAILLLSDGADTTSIATAQDAIDAARVVNVPVFPVILGTAGRDLQLEALLTEIARATGGLPTRDVSVTGLGEAYDRVLAYLRSSYVLVYDPNEPAPPSQQPARPPATEPAPEQPWHEIRVTLRRPLLNAIVRPGYYR